MMISIPLVAVAGVFAAVAWRYMRLKAWQALLCLLVGFLLAATNYAPPLRHLIAALVRALGVVVPCYS
jgi:hypothetical protein